MATTEGRVASEPGITRFSAGLRFHQLGELHQAEECYRETIRIDPEHPDANHLLGVVALQQGRHDESIAFLSKALRLKPSTAEYHNNIASAYRESKKFDEAAEHYRQAIDLKPNYAIAQHNLGNVLEELGCFQEAEGYFRQAVDLLPELAHAPRVTSGQFSDGSNEETRSDGERTIGGSSSPSDYRTQVVLHVGCGPPNPELLDERFRGPEWQELRLDIDPETCPDIVASLTDMSTVSSESVDAVWSSHNLEHLRRHEVPIALLEFYRVLKPGGLALVTMPDLQQAAHYVVADKLEDVGYVSPAGPITPLDCIFGQSAAVEHGNDFMCHKTGFTERSLRQRLTETGFVELRLWTSPFNLWAEAYKPESN